MFSHLPSLGVGMGFREPYRSELFLRREGVDFLEITAEHYLDVPPWKERELDLLAEHFTLIPHAINLSLGSAEGLDRMYLKKLARLVERLDPPWWSEHVAYTRAGGVDIGHLSPMPWTDEAIDVLCRNIDEVRRHIKAPLILENITYMMKLPGGEFEREADFITRLLERTGCGLLLDVTNLHINSVNHDYDAREFLERLPLERVVQLHFVGGCSHDGLLIDSHSHRTPDEIWTLLEETLARAPVKGAILERDENLPPFEELLEELERARAAGRRCGRWG